MTLIQPTDIMLGRGPTCYNNPGNKAFRKVLKEHVVLYRNQALRKEKAALVKLLVSKLEANGYRFLHRSSSGTWVEAPAQIAENKVGHGLRDLRLASAKTRSDTNKLSKNFCPAITEQEDIDQVTPAVISGEAQTTEGMWSMKSDDNTGAITTDADPHCHGATTKQQINVNSLISSPNTPFDFALALHEYPLADGAWEKAELSSLAYVFEEASEPRKSGGHAVNIIYEQREYGSLSTSDSEVEQRLEQLDRRCNVIKDTSILPAASANNWATYDAHDGLDSVGVALNKYEAGNGRSIGNFFVDDAYQPLARDVEDAQSLCRWFRRHHL